MIKVLFFGIETKDHMCEYDFIVNELLPSQVERDDYFLSLENIKNTTEKFDIFVYFCREPQNYSWSYIPTYNEVLEAVLKTNPEIIIQLSDEFVSEDLQDHNKLANYCQLFLRNYHHKNYFYTDNTVHIPLGYTNECKVFQEKKDLNWSFLGEIKSDRSKMITSFLNIPNHFVGRSMPKDEMCKIYSRSIFVPCGRGNSSLDCFRLYEASMNGAIPVVVGSKKEIETTFKYEKNPPWIFATSWEDAVKTCKDLLNDEEKIISIRADILLWWQNRINDIKKIVEKCLIENSVNKLKNFPKIYCVSLEENSLRRNMLLSEFSKYDIAEINFLLSKKYPDNNHIIESDYLDDDIVNLRGADCTASHINMLNKWIEDTDDDYAFFCEDDLSLETVSYWNFTWDEFYSKLPKDWECIQLFIISDHFKVESLEIAPRMWNFWGATAYLMKKDYAKKIVNTYYKNNKYVLNPINETPIHCYWNPDWMFPDQSIVSVECCLFHHKLPIVENILFTGIGKVYNCPIFIENISIDSTFVSGHKFGHLESHESILNSWRLHKQNKLSLQFMD
jgi:hypothetical protein